MSAIKSYFGLLLLIIAPILIYELVSGAVANIDTHGTKEINNPVIWIIIIAIFTPIAIGLMIFGWYAFRGEYDHMPRRSKDL
jgi:Na+/serine symporter